MTDRDDDIIIPVIREELHVDAVPVQTGGVRVTKRSVTHNEVLEQELRKGKVEVRRVQANRLVDGPQQPTRVGNTLVIPVVSEILRIEKQWVVTEEIHITQTEERETVQHEIPLKVESVEVERLDADGRPTRKPGSQEH